MKDALALLAVAAGLLLTANAVFGYSFTYEISYGAFTIMAAMVSLTFLWLWQTRATPLASGMAFSWAGSASVMGWWWMYNLLERPEIMNESPVLFLCLAIYFVGAVLHFSVIGRSLGVSRKVWIIPICLAIGVSTALHLTQH